MKDFREQYHVDNATVFGDPITIAPGTFHDDIDPIPDEDINVLRTEPVKVIPKSPSKVFIEKVSKVSPRSVIGTIWKIARFIGQAFAGAIILQFMAGIVPEIQDKIPNLFRLLDAVDKVLDIICSWLVPYIGMF